MNSQVKSSLVDGTVITCLNSEPILRSKQDKTGLIRFYVDDDFGECCYETRMGFITIHFSTKAKEMIQKHGLRIMIKACLNGFNLKSGVFVCQTSPELVGKIEFELTNYNENGNMETSVDSVFLMTNTD
jgi:hypothetical protein